MISEGGNGNQAAGIGVLWAFFLAFVILGSLFPFQFDFSQIDAITLEIFWASAFEEQTRSDIVANILLFIPAGTLGMATLWRQAFIVRSLIVLVVCFIVGFGVQVIQLALPRVPSIGDVYWNMVGTVIGMAPALLPWRRVLEIWPIRIALVPSLAVGCWVGANLSPFLGTMGVQNLIDSVQPVFEFSDIAVLAVISGACAWASMGYFINKAVEGLHIPGLLAIGAFATLLAQAPIVKNQITSTELLAVIGGLLLWYTWLCRIPRDDAKQAIIMLIIIHWMILSFTPFVFSGTPQTFYWIPLDGIDLTQTVGLVKHFMDLAFIATALVYLIGGRIGSYAWASVIVVGISALITLFQVFMPGKQAWTTDMSIVAGMGLTVWLIQRWCPVLETVPEPYTDGDQAGFSPLAAAATDQPVRARVRNKVRLRTSKSRS